MLVDGCMLQTVVFAIIEFDSPMPQTRLIWGLEHGTTSLHAAYVTSSTCSLHVLMPEINFR